MNARGRASFRGVRRSEGFTLVEVLLVMIIIGILALIAIPNFKIITIKARAVDVVADIDVIEQAVRNYQADNNTWPPDAPAGVVPPGLAGYLPGGFEMGGPDFVLDWENFSLPGRLPGDPSTSRILGVGVVTSLQELGDALTQLFGTVGWYTAGGAYTKIIERE